MGLRMQPRHETFVTLFGKAGSNIVESVAILMPFAAVRITHPDSRDHQHRLGRHALGG
jgi:hypothetical protein